LRQNVHTTPLGRHYYQYRLWVTDQSGNIAVGEPVTVSPYDDGIRGEILDHSGYELSMEAINAELQNRFKNAFSVHNATSHIPYKNIINACIQKIERLVCCIDPGNFQESCSFCFLTKEEVIAKIKGDGYIDFKDVMEFMYEGEFTAEMYSKQYSHIESSVGIKYTQNGESYHFTDILDGLCEDLSHYSVKATVFDDSPLSSDILCFGEADESSSARIMSVTDYSSDIIVLNYEEEITVLVKHHKNINGAFPNKIMPFYYYINVKDQLCYGNTISHKEVLDGIKEGIVDCDVIYKNNGSSPSTFMWMFNESFFDHQIIDSTEFKDIAMNNLNVVFHVHNTCHNEYQYSCPLGRIEFETGDCMNLKFRKNCPHSPCACSLVGFEQWGQCTSINAGRTIKRNEVNTGYVIAHEILHVLTIRGTKVLCKRKNGPLPYRLTNYRLTDSEHIDDEDENGKIVRNLLNDGRKVSSPTKRPKPNNLTPAETINPLAAFLTFYYYIEILVL
jgi:hypothetical protein